LTPFVVSDCVSGGDPVDLHVAVKIHVNAYVYETPAKTRLAGLLGQAPNRQGLGHLACHKGRGLVDGPAQGAQGPGGKCLPARCPVGQLDHFSRTAVINGVVAHNIPPRIA